MIKFRHSATIAISTFMMLGMAGTPAHAGGNNLLSGINLNFWSGSSGGASVAHHRERGERAGHNAGQDCWYENRWQKTRHGNRLVERVRVCS